METSVALGDSTWFKVFVVFLAALLGWLAGQGGKLLEEWRTRRRLKRQLVEELSHILNTLQMANQGFLRTLQLTALDKIEFDATLQFVCPIYDGYYKDVCGYLNSSQRASFDKIHSVIREIHNLRDEQRECATAIQRGSNPDILRWWSCLAQFQFCEFHELDFLLRHHLANLEDPEIRLDEPAHRDYLRHIQSIHNEIPKILEGAKEIDPRVAAIRYHPDMFPDLKDLD